MWFGMRISDKQQKPLKMFNNTTQEAKISIGNIFAILFGIVVIGICVFAAFQTYQDTAAAKNILEEAISLRNKGKYQEAIDKYLEIPKEHPLSLSQGKYLEELIDEFPQKEIFNVASNLRGRYKKDKERYFINTAIKLYEYLVEKYPELAIKAEVEKINTEIEKMGKPIQASIGKKETGKNLNGKSEVTIFHEAGDEIEVLFAGPSPKRIKVPDGKSETALLTPGKYIIGIKDANPSNKVEIRSNSYTATFKANKSYEHKLRFEVAPF